jgi:hypothetical protein
MEKGPLSGIFRLYSEKMRVVYFGSSKDVAGRVRVGNSGIRRGKKDTWLKKMGLTLARDARYEVLRFGEIDNLLPFMEQYARGYATSGWTVFGVLIDLDAKDGIVEKYPDAKVCVEEYLDLKVETEREFVNGLSGKIEFHRGIISHNETGKV